jgi:hypothetical protein
VFIKTIRGHGYIYDDQGLALLADDFNPEHPA